MKIKVVNSSRVEISGKINTYDNYMKVKQAISELIDMECKNIEIEFLDAETITSTLIGYLTKEKNSRKVSFSLIIHNKRLVQLLSHIGLDQAFDIRNP